MYFQETFSFSTDRKSREKAIKKKAGVIDFVRLILNQLLDAEAA